MSWKITFVVFAVAFAGMGLLTSGAERAIFEVGLLLNLAADAIIEEIKKK